MFPITLVSRCPVPEGYGSLLAGARFRPPEHGTRVCVAGHWVSSSTALQQCPLVAHAGPRAARPGREVAPGRIAGLPPTCWSPGPPDRVGGAAIAGSCAWPETGSCGWPCGYSLLVPPGSSLVAPRRVLLPVATSRATARVYPGRGPSGSSMRLRLRLCAMLRGRSLIGGSIRRLGRLGRSDEARQRR